MIPYGRQHISDEDVAAVVEVLRSDWLTQGPMVPRFERTVANYCGPEYAVAVNSATSALHIACLALDLGPGDWLWTSPITFVASSNCALYCNARVDFVDIDPFTYNLCAKKLAEKLEEAERAGRLPKIVVPVHLCGQSCDMEAIHALSLRYGFKIIEDASHAIGGFYQGRPIGDCHYSDITVFSFHPVKIITSGEGGMAVTGHPELAERMMRYRSHGITNNRDLMWPKPNGQIWNYQQVDLGFNYRMTDIHAALGVSQMARLDDFIKRRRGIAAAYDRAFADLPMLRPWQHPNTRSSYHLYPIRVRAPGKTQRDVYDALNNSGVAANLHYIPVYLQPYYMVMGYGEGYCPEAEAYYKEAISLPMYASLSEAQQAYVISAVRAALA